MSKVKVLSASDIEGLLTLPMAVEAVEQAYLQKSAGQAGVWPMVFHEFDPGRADLDIKSGHLGGEGVYGLKVVSWFGDNPARDLPALFGTSLVFDLNTGAPKALLNAGPITDFRTGAAGAIGAKYLARPDSRTLLMAGCGALAPYLIAAALYLLPGLERVLLANPRTPERAEARCGAVTQTVDALLARCGAARRAELVPCPDLEAGVRAADIIFTATPSYTPFIQAQWVRPGTHLSCVGADMSGKEEVDPQLFRSARVFGDDREQCFAVGECELPHKQGVFSDLAGEIGQVMAGQCPGRTADSDITIFDSTGVSLQDVATAAKLLDAAERTGAGVTAEL